MKITDLPNDLLSEMIMKMDPEAAQRLIASSKDIYNSIGESEKEALYWLNLKGPRAFIPYMSHLNKSYSEMQPKQKRTAKLLIQSYPTPEAFVFDAFKIDSLASIKCLEQALGRNLIKDKLRLIKKQLELCPNKYPGNIMVQLEQIGYGNLEIEPLSERFKKLKSVLSDIEMIDFHFTQQRILESTEPTEPIIADINCLMRDSSLKLLKNLTEFGGDVDFAISKAIRDPIIMKYLIENGADVINYSGYVRKTPLHCAAKMGNPEVVKLLLEHGANIGATNSYGDTPLHWAAEYGNKDVVVLLLERGAEKGAAGKNGYTPLHCAAKRGKKEVVKFLLEHCANIGATNNYRKTPLHLRAKYGNDKVGELLLDNDSHVNAVSIDGRTPLHYASECGHKEVVELLFAHGANFNTADDYGYTPLHMAALFGKKEVVECLLYRGANAKVPDIDGSSPFDLAKKYRHIEIVDILQQYIAKKDAETSA